LTYRIHVIPSLRAWQWPNGVKSRSVALAGSRSLAWTNRVAPLQVETTRPPP
ncbi:unnamed protein product, partial [Arabidopsis halleri]